MMCGAIPVPCEVCGKYWRIEKFSNCSKEERR